MKSDKNQADRVFRQISSIISMAANGSRSWEWIATKLQGIIDSANYIKERRPIFGCLCEELKTKFTTFGSGAARNIELLVLESITLGIYIPNKSRTKFLEEEVCADKSTQIRFITPQDLNDINPDNINMLMLELDKNPKSPGIHSFETINALCETLANLVVKELAENHKLNQAWISSLEIYMIRLLQYTVLNYIHHDQLFSFEAQKLYSLIVDTQHRDIAGGINIPLGFYQSALLVLISDTTTD